MGCHEMPREAYNAYAARLPKNIFEVIGLLVSIELVVNNLGAIILSMAARYTLGEASS